MEPPLPGFDKGIGADTSRFGRRSLCSFLISGKCKLSKRRIFLCLPMIYIYSIPEMENQRIILNASSLILGFNCGFLKDRKESRIELCPSSKALLTSGEDACDIPLSQSYSKRQSGSR